MKFREITTDVVVDVTGLPVWEGEPVFARVTYPTGKEFYMRFETVWLHFQQLPDDISMRGDDGGSCPRPTRAQEALTNAIAVLVAAARKSVLG